MARWQYDQRTHARTLFSVVIVGLLAPMTLLAQEPRLPKLGFEESTAQPRLIQ